MADVADITKGPGETVSGPEESEEKTNKEAKKDEETSATEVQTSSSNDPILDARTQLANLISLVHSVESSTGEPDHKKVVYEVFGTVFILNFLH